MLGSTRLMRTVRVWRCTTEAKNQITEQANKHANEGPKVGEPRSGVLEMRLTKVICWNQAKFGADVEKHVSDDAKKTFFEVIPLFESVLEQLSESGMTGLTYEAFKNPQMRKKVHQIKERREVLEEAPGVQQRKRE